MALAPHALVTVAELVAALGRGAESAFEAIINSASRAIESHCRRRLVYRAPVEGLASVVASVLPANGALTVVPLAGPRTLIVDITDPDRSLGGTLTITGTVAGASVSRTFDLARGGRQHCPDFFTGTPTIALSGVSGATSSDRISVGTSEGYCEFHSPPETAPVVRLMNWPVVQVLSVHESSDRTWDSDSILTVDDDFAVSREAGTLTRLSGGAPSLWAPGWRTVRTIHSDGYRSTAVPEDLRYACTRLCALMWREQDSKTYGVQGSSNETGNWTRYLQADIDREIARLLQPFRRQDRGASTGERPTLDPEDC